MTTKQAVEAGRTTPCGALRVLWVSPKPEFQASMIFIERQIASLLAAGVAGQTFHLESRTSPLAVFRAFRRLRAKIREFQPHIVHAQYGTATAFLCLFASRRPLIVSFRGSDLNPNRNKGRVRCFASRLMSQLAAAPQRRIICVSEQLVQRLWWGREKVQVIPSGIDTEIFAPRGRDAARAMLAWDPQERVVLFNGSNRAVKRPDLARAAVEVARGACGPVRLLELDGTQPPDLVPWMMSASDCLIVTSDHEGSPNVVKEAIACGLPVVTRDVGDARQRLANVHPSRVTGDSAEDLGAALAEILACGMRSDGPAVAAEFSLELIARRIVALYEAALRGGKIASTVATTP